jgi:GT2 family glycosyltransferase
MSKYVELTAGNGAVIVIHYGPVKYTVACLRSLASSYELPGIVYLVNNTDVPWEEAETPNSLGVEELRPGTNLGFAGGVNLGVRTAQESGAKWCWLLNNDAVVESDCLESLLRCLNENTEADIVGSLIQMENGKIWYGGGKFQSRTGRAIHQHYGEDAQSVADNVVHVTDWVTGCSLMFRVSAYVERGPFEENFFLYREELEWQLRSWRIGQAIVIGRPLVTHAVGISTGGGGGKLGTVFMVRNQILLTNIHGGRYRSVWLFCVAIDYFLRPLLRGRLARCKWAWLGMRSVRAAPLQVLASLRPDVPDVDC